MIRLVTFDLDNTLWAVDAVIRRAERALDDWLDQRVPEYNQLPADSRKAIAKSVAAADPGIVHDISRLRETVLRETVEHCGYPPDDAAQLAADAFAEFMDWRHRVQFFPAAVDVLAELAGDYTLAALTNGNANFERLGLDRYFAFGYCAAEVGAKKPDPAMFVRAMAHAGVTPDQAVHVGDHAVDDVQGAAAVGMATIWVNLSSADEAPRGADEAPRATATVTRLQDLPPTLARLSGQRQGYRTP